MLGRRFQFFQSLFLQLSLFAAACFGVDSGEGVYFGSEDFHMRGALVQSFQSASDEHILTFGEGFECIIGDNHFKSDKAVVWLKSVSSGYRGVVSVDYNVLVYLEGNASRQAGAGARLSGVSLSSNKLNGAEALIAQFSVSGEVFVTADKRVLGDPRASKLYRDGLVATGKLKLAPVSARKVYAKDSGQGVSAGEVGVSGAIAGQAGDGEVVETVALPKFQYPVNISGIGQEQVKITNERLADGSSIATVMNRFYLWQKSDEQGGLLEFQADNAVIFYSQTAGGQQLPGEGVFGGGSVKSVYLGGDVVMTEGGRTVRSDEAFYDFQYRRGLAINAVMRTYDQERGIPIYVKAEKLRQVAENKFAAENVVITNSEFYKPEIEVSASSIVVTDLTNVPDELKDSQSSYDAIMRDVKLSLNDFPLFYLPKLRSDLERPDLPLRRLNVGDDSSFGMIVESEWYLSRVLGLREPEGVDSSLLVDYYSDRGVGAGANIEYEREDYFGSVQGYLIDDSGEDDLGRSRKNVRHGSDYRGQFLFNHRHFLPYDWQLTLEAGYLSDENFYESYRRSDFFTGKDKETLIHLKRLQDNWAFSILGKWRINDFEDTKEELPSVQYHLTGQSLFDDKFTFYSNNAIGVFKQRIGSGHSISVSEGNFTAGSTRNELDMPLNLGSAKFVPYIAGTVGYDDRSGFVRGVVDGSGGTAGDNEVFIGEVGARASTQYWKVNKELRSEFWDIDGLRHIVKPYASAALFSESDNAVNQKNIFNAGLLQRWQTKRGLGDKRRNVEWMRLDIDVTMVDGDDSSLSRPDEYVYNSPFVPLGVMSAPDILNSDLAGLRMFEVYGPQRDNLNADYIWRISDTTAISSGINYDLQSNEVEQFDIGLSRLRWPNLSYYIGSRYLRSTNIDGEKGSNAVTFAATYRINPRYTVSISHQYDYDYGKLITSEISLLRRYHRIVYGFTVSRDESLDRNAIVFSIWPEGVSELSMGSGSVLDLDTPRSRGY